eukprot:CAMPEP_0206442900 /NCGR_PEP_ID=MMETSP0324_2-20121206/14077_1 /ASSEMBLY_ACC=CAM_ASM_000836 /TAXON_ID=2866 /ORGANISM="Crypthecodinium cohnii, Strain Seligo" /LENGTH=315 /DNA_ID=CAMNT_0053910791 /DNA_START=79 /DNA_END=1026 /DNA_ORIENTATION=+
MPFVKFENIAREWRFKWSTDDDNASLMKAQSALEDVLADISSLEGASSVQRVVCGGCQDFKVITKLSEKAFKEWEAKSFEPEAAFLEAVKKIPGITQVETQTYTLEEVKMNKKDIKKAQEKKDKEAAEKKDEKPAEDPAKKLKKVIKEGGKRGVEIEGAADMGGLQFFCTSVDEPEGNLDLLKESVAAMNAKSDPTEEERKGGSGHIGKMVFSAGIEQLAIVAYVPEDKREALSCQEWLQKVVSMFPGGKVVDGAADISTGVIPTDSDKGVFPLKIRESLILEANNFLRKLGLFPEDDGDDDDEMVFGDDDFPSM